MEQQHSSSFLSEQDRFQHKQYFQRQVNPIFSNLITNIVKSKPENILQFTTKWFKYRKGDPNRSLDDQIDSDEDSEMFVTVSDQQFQIKKQHNHRKRRYGVTSQVYGPNCRRQSIKLCNGFVKAQHTHMRLLFFCQNNFLFRNFSQNQIGLLIKMMNKRITTSNEVVFEQGEWGDSIYFVDEGFFECIQQTDNGPKSIRYYHVGDTFGQVCLLHLIKRKASIVSRSEGILYTLNRQSYIHYKKMCITKRRALYTYTLKKQTLFSNFSDEELQKICDVLTEIHFEEGDLIINEGDVGSKFYIILDGILIAYKGIEDNIVQCYRQGDGFGEIALIKDTPRQASVKSLTRSRLVYMTQQVFKRIFQNVNLEKQIEQKYKDTRSNLVTRRRDCNDETAKSFKNLKEDQDMSLLI